MNRWMWAVLALACGLMPQAAAAQQTRQFGWQGYCQMTSSLSSAARLTTANCSTGSVPPSPSYAEICVSVQGVRYISDPSRAPTASIGIPVSPGTCFQYAGPINLVQFIQQTAGAVLDIEFFQ